MNQNHNSLDEIKETIGGLLDLMGFSCEIEVKKQTDLKGDFFYCNIISDNDSNLLIGQHGVNLKALQYIVRLILKSKEIGENRVVLDINAYRSEKNNSIIRYAQEMAVQAVKENKTLTLKPMSPFERRLVHLELEKNKKVFSESVGQDESRRIVVSPVK